LPPSSSASPRPGAWPGSIRWSSPADQRILGSNYGGVDPRRDFPRLVDLYMEGRLPVDRLISGRRPLAEAQSALEELERGTALRTLLVP